MQAAFSSRAWYYFHGGSYLKFSSQKKLWNSTVFWKIKVQHTILCVRWIAKPGKRCIKAKYGKVELVFIQQFQKEQVVHQYCLWEESYVQECAWITKGDLLCGLTVKINNWKEGLYRIIFWQWKCQIQDRIAIISF